MIEILSYQFMQFAIITGILIGFTASYYGVFVVQRRMSFLGSGLAHAAFGGVALGLLLETEPLITAIPFTILVSILITWIKQKTTLAVDTSIGIFFAVSVALGIIFISIKDGFSVDAFNYLFGSILNVNEVDLFGAILLTLVTIASFILYWSKWAYSTFDSELAKSDKLNVVRNDYILSILIALTIVISIKIIGIILIAAFLVIPPAAARLVSKTFFQMTIISVIFGILSVLSGLMFAFMIDLPSGATIILVQAVIFIFCFTVRNFKKE